MTQTNQRIEIYSWMGNYTNRNSEFPAGELNFIRRVKDHIIKNGLYKKVPNKFKTESSRKKIRYFFVSDRYHIGDRIENCYEVDLNSAYWETAYKLGLLSDNLYHKGKEVSKMSRLAAIGTLAKVVKRFEFDGEKERQLRSKKSKFTEFLWPTICARVGKLMYRCARLTKKDFIFVWVDAMFVKKEALPTIKEILKAAGYAYTIEKVDWIQFNAVEIQVKGKGKWAEEDGKRIWKDTRDFSYSVGNGMDPEHVKTITEIA